MFRKVTTVVGLCLLAACVWFLYQVNEEQKSYRAQVDELHAKVAMYHDHANTEANFLAAKLAAPYYIELDYVPGQKARRMESGATPIDHVDVIRSVAYTQGNLRFAPADEQRAYLMAHTPAPVLFDLHSALQEMEVLRSQLSWRDFSSLDEARQQFAEAQKTMKEALTEARAYGGI